MSTERDMIAGEDDASLLANAMDNEGPADTEADKAEVETEIGEQPRDEQGRFAAKSEKTEEQPIEQPHQATPERRDDDSRIPSYRLKEEADAKRAERERADRLERENAEMRQMFMALMQKNAPQQPVAQTPPPDLFEAPDQYVGYQVDQRVSPQIEAMRQSLMYNARLVASAVHGDTTVKEAEEAFNNAARSGTIDPAVHQRINSSPNPFAAAVDWFKREQVLREVGTDPKSYRERVLTEAMSDPDFVAKVIAAQRNGGSAPADQRNNITRLPPSLSRTSGKAASNPADQHDDSDAGLLRSALSR